MGPSNKLLSVPDQSNLHKVEVQLSEIAHGLRQNFRDGNGVNFAYDGKKLVEVRRKLEILAKFGICGEIIQKSLKEFLERSSENNAEITFIEQLALHFMTKSLPKICSITCDFPPFTSDISSNISTGFNKSLPFQVSSSAPARIDLAGGWSDTPPITYECLTPPAVLNLAVRVNNKRPIHSRCSRLGQFEGFFYKDISGSSHTLHFKKAADVVENCNRPSQTGSLICAILVSSGLIRSKRIDGVLEHHFNFGEANKCRGIFVETESNLPHGSGLGTSSILAGAVLAALWELQGIEYTDSDLIQTVLKVEQLHTTGGGWQDQIGGCIPGGFKLGTISSKDHHRCIWEAVPISREFKHEIEQRLIMVYTGICRLAKDVLQKVILRWLRGDEKILKTVAELSEGAREAKKSLENGQFPFQLCARYNQLKKEFAEDSEKPIVRELREALKGVGLADTAWVAGAGGGGYLYVWLAKEKTLKDLKVFLQNEEKWSKMETATIEVDEDPLKILRN